MLGEDASDAKRWPLQAPSVRPGVHEGHEVTLQYCGGKMLG